MVKVLLLVDEGSKGQLSDIVEKLTIRQGQGAGHFTHQEQPAVVNKLLIEWFREHDAVAV